MLFKLETLNNVNKSFNNKLLLNTGSKMCAWKKMLLITYTEKCIYHSFPSMFLLPIIIYNCSYKYELKRLFLINIVTNVIIHIL